MPSRDEIHAALSGHLQEMFGVPADKIVPAARLYEDLELDSIDAIDMAVRIEEKTHLAFSGDDLQSIQTIQDAVDLIHGRL